MVECECAGIEYEYEEVTAEDIVAQVGMVSKDPVEAIQSWLHASRELRALRSKLLEMQDNGWEANYLGG